MANLLFPKYKEACLSGAAPNLSSVNVAFVLLRGYTYNAAHDMLDDVTGAGATLVGTPQNATTKDVTNGVFNCDDPTFPTVPAGAQCDHLLIYHNTGTPATSRLIALFDTATGLPVTPNGADVTVILDNGASKVFAL